MMNKQCVLLLALLSILFLPSIAGLVQAMQPPENRFIVLPPGDWVLDTTTSLLWQQEPGSANVVGDGASCNGGATCTWQEARDYCAALGGGTRLPEIKELIGLVDYEEGNQATALNTPNGPFNNVESGDYWSGTATVTDPNDAWSVQFTSGPVFGDNKISGSNRAWCVR